MPFLIIWGLSQILRERGTSLVVQWLRLRLPKQGVWVQSLIRELRSHTLLGQETKTQNNIIKNAVKTDFKFKML